MRFLGNKLPWNEVDTMCLRHEFVALAVQEEANVRELCRRFQISSKTGYKWLGRYASDGVEGLADRSRRPHNSPGRTPDALEAAVVRVRDLHPAWGGRKIRVVLQREGLKNVPSANTITAILRRHGRLNLEEAVKHKPWQRFEASRSNELWQMDFKGWVPLTAGGRLHALTVIDDHSRFSLTITACANQKGTTVQASLIPVFERYGMPEWIMVDNGSPWGNCSKHRHTPLTVWWMQLGIGVSHSRPFHPQTMGKDERFHRTLKAEVLRYHDLTDIHHSQRVFDQWRRMYNTERPHQALDLAVPASRYQPSARPYPVSLPDVEYGPDDITRKVQSEGVLNFQGRRFQLPHCFRGQPVALRATGTDSVFDVYFCNHVISRIDLREDESE